MSRHAAARSSPTYRRAVRDIQGNPGQLQAYNSARHCAVLAGPGSGKTKTLTLKIAKLLIDNIPALRGLACITYNTECERELKARLELLGIVESASVYIGTLHGFCLNRIIAPYAALGGQVLPAPLRVALRSEQEVAFAHAVEAVISPDVPPSQWRQQADLYRRTHLNRSAPEWHSDEQLADLVAQYEQNLRRQGMIDFDDMVLLGLQLVEEHPWVRRALRAKFPAIVIDEYQDLGAPLHRIVMNLCFRGGCRLFAVGDPDQSIYGFAGAQPDLLRRLSDSPRVERVVLPFNYRSGSTIVAASEIALGEERGYEARGETEGTVDFHERPEGLRDQADFVCRELIPGALERLPGLRLGDIAVLYLDKYDGDIISQSAQDYRYRTIRLDSGGPYARTALTGWLEECAAWCAGGWRTGQPRLSGVISRWASILKLRPTSDRRASEQKVRLMQFLLRHRDPGLRLHAWLRGFEQACLQGFLDQPTLRDERDAFHRLIAAAEPGSALADWSVSTFGGQRGSPDHLNLITLHSAKGLEFRVVIMMGMDQGRMPHWNAGDIAKREQRRLFYVGVSRAKDEVHMTYSGFTENRYGRRFNRGPSEFLVEVRNRLQP